MVFFTSNMFFGDSKVSISRHFHDVSNMNSRIIENWNSVITPEDKVYILGGVGDFEYLLSLNGEKVLMFTENERTYYTDYIKSVTSEEEDSYNQEMFEVYVKEMFYVSKVVFSKSIILKDHTGRVLRLSTNKSISRNSDNFVIAGNMGDYQRGFSNGINSDIYVNGLFPLSSTDVQRFYKNFYHKK